MASALCRTDGRPEHSHRDPDPGFCSVDTHVPLLSVVPARKSWVWMTCLWHLQEQGAGGCTMVRTSAELVSRYMSYVCELVVCIRERAWSSIEQ